MDILEESKVTGLCQPGKSVYDLEIIKKMELSTLKTDKYEPVEQFYDGKSVLITGGTGFLGKVLIEKLVYSCPGLNNVYVLVRDKKNISSRDRFNNMINSKIFERIRKEKPHNLEKIHFVMGDITLDDLGMTNDDKTTILEKVSIVFHLAATVRFDEPLKQAMRINVEGTRNMIRFSQQLKDLQAFVYMSTAYCNTDKMVLEEIVYPTPMEIGEVYKFLELHGDSNLIRVQEILKETPNTYTFTKALTESMVDEIRGDMPITIIRPSIVVAAMHEPYPGWIDTWLGPTPALDVIARGWLLCYYGKEDYALDIIPVDYVINATIVAAARCQKSKKLPVYNCCTSVINTITLRDVCTLYTTQSNEVGYNELPLHRMFFTESSIILNFFLFIYQTLLAYVFDFLLLIKREPTKHVKRTRKFQAYLKFLKFFTSRNWFMTSSRLQALEEDLDQADRQKFPCNPANITWTDFIPIYFNGVLKFLIGNKKFTA